MSQDLNYPKVPLNGKTWAYNFASPSDLNLKFPLCQGGKAPSLKNKHRLVDQKSKSKQPSKVRNNMLEKMFASLNGDITLYIVTES